jgi:hypothetical protein
MTMASITLGLDDNNEVEIYLGWSDTNGRKLETKLELITTCSRPKTLAIKINGNLVAKLEADQRGGFKGYMATLSDSLQRS